MSGCTLLKGSL